MTRWSIPAIMNSIFMWKTPEIRIPSIPVIWIVLAIFLPIEAVLVYCYHNADDHMKSTIVFAASVVGGAFALYSHMKHIEEVRVTYAAKLIERWGSAAPNVEGWKDLLRDITAGKINNVEQFARRREADEKIVLPEELGTRSKIVGLLSYAEEIALAVRTNNADGELIRRQLESVLTTSYEKLQSWIDTERKTANNDRSLYREIELLTKAWSRSDQKVQ